MSFLFEPPDVDDVLNGALKAIPEEERIYWEAVRSGPEIKFEDLIYDVFSLFRGARKSVRILEIPPRAVHSDTGGYPVLMEASEERLRVHAEAMSQEVRYEDGKEDSAN